MSEPKTFLVPVGLPKRGINAVLCEAGHAKLQRFAAKVQYRTSEGLVWISHHEWGRKQVLNPKRKPYIFARYNDPATGKTMRPELGRWLLGCDLPVVHRNGNPLDFRLCNLEERLSERQILRRAYALIKRTIVEAKKERAAARRAAKKPVTPDGLTPEQQLEVAFEEKFRNRLIHAARAIVRDDMTDGTGQVPTDERRGDEVVSMVVNDSIAAIQAGRVKNVRNYLWVAMLTQARLEYKRKLAGLGHVRKPRQESQNLSIEDHVTDRMNGEAPEEAA